MLGSSSLPLVYLSITYLKTNSTKNAPSCISGYVNYQNFLGEHDPRTPYEFMLKCTQRQLLFKIHTGLTLPVLFDLY